MNPDEYHAALADIHKGKKACLTCGKLFKATQNPNYICGSIGPEEKGCKDWVEATLLLVYDERPL